MSTATLLSNPDTARREIFSSHFALVDIGVARFSARWPTVDRDDLRSAAMTALWDATLRVDVTREPQLVAAYIKRAIHNEMTVVAQNATGVSRFTSLKRRNFHEAKAALADELLREPTHEELAERLGMSLKELRRTQAGIESNDKPVSLESVPEQADPVSNPVDGIESAERFGYLRNAVACLPARMRQVIEISYFEDRSLVDASRQLGISGARVTILRQEAIKRLRRLSTTRAMSDAVA